ncbi:unnamed protein product [Mesocestoides corti]|uniref:DUF5733 domain-containing protein n=1 Tax=Mesocestoides corti TaxID=53468 RepID=A0A0R3UG96_MESCO|nr:unnamed protein product [Mesocestoides corti]
MSVVVSHNPRQYSKNGHNNPLNPPVCSTVATLLERKFIATGNSTPLVNAERLARTIVPGSEYPRDIGVCIYTDRLLFRSSTRGPEISDIFYDDIIQIDLVSGMHNVLFVLCGRRGFGSYYFLKFPDYAVAEKIRDLVNRVNPEACLSRDGYRAPTRNHFLRANISKNNSGDYYFEFSGLQHEHEASFCSTVGSDDSDGISIKPLQRTNSFIRWEGSSRSRTSDGKRGRKYGIKGKESPIYTDRSPSVSNSREPSWDTGSTFFIQAQGSRQGHKSRSTNTHRPITVFNDTRRHRNHSRTSKRPTSEATKRGGQSQGFNILVSQPNHSNRSQSRKKGKKKDMKMKYVVSGDKKQIPKVRAPVHSMYGFADESDDSSSSLDPSAEVKVGMHRYVGERHRKTHGDARKSEQDDQDWESIDSWDTQAPRRKGPCQGVTFNVHPSEVSFPQDGDCDLDEITSTSEDSLYLEHEQHYGILFPKREVNFMPELQQRFREWNVK